MSVTTISLPLNGAWTLHYGPQKTAACEMTDPEIPADFTTCSASVPGNVELDLVASGVLPADLDHGDNIYAILPFEKHQWWLEHSFGNCQRGIVRLNL